MKITLGEKYRDRVSGWESIAVARYEYMNGCIRYELAAKDDKGAPTAFVFDEQQLEAVASEPVPTEPRRTGGARGTSPVAR